MSFAHIKMKTSILTLSGPLQVFSQYTLLWNVYKGIHKLVNVCIDKAGSIYSTGEGQL